ncbi:MAG: nucleotide exchange factor GrpE [Gammaproteobacteria bacterium]|nr:nucleotide exchange factor GrpE [Gammaproteobacteria bacterium]
MAKRAKKPSEAGDGAVKESAEAGRVDEAPAGSDVTESANEESGADADAQNELHEAESLEEQMQAQIEALQAKADDHWDRFLRTQAEMENLRKRSQRDVENAHKFALEGFAGELLGVRDSLEMGLSAASRDDGSVISIREGIELTLKLLTQTMEKYNVIEINPLGEKFDPEHHQAMNMLEDQNAAPNTVVMVIQKGYLLNGRLLRPALVSVAK